MEILIMSRIRVILLTGLFLTGVYFMASGCAHPQDKSAPKKSSNSKEGSRTTTNPYN